MIMSATKPSSTSAKLAYLKEKNAELKAANRCLQEENAELKAANRCLQEELNIREESWETLIAWSRNRLSDFEMTCNDIEAKLSSLATLNETGNTTDRGKSPGNLARSHSLSALPTNTQSTINISSDSP